MGTSVPLTKHLENLMRGFPGTSSLLISLKYFALLGLGLAFTFSPAWAQPISSGSGTNPTSDGITFFTNKPSFLIPFSQDPNDTRINSILLHVSEDYGRTYRYLGYAQQNQRTFSYRAPKDGWYWFSVQTQDKQGRYYPANMNQALPGLKVCVDSVPPQVYLKGSSTSAGAATVDWEIKDENVDLATLRLESRPAGAAEWAPLTAQPLINGSHAWNPGAGQIEVHLSVRDKSGNLGEQTLLLVPGQTKTAGVQTAALAGAGVPTNGLPPNVLMVNHRQFQLNFKLEDVGPSDVARIEVWFTRDGGRTWRKFEQDADKTPPCKLEVPEEGRYGFTLIARSGVELSEPPPKPGDLPHIWVEVDETKPQLRLLGVEVGRGIDQGTMTIMWTAADKFLGPTPLTLSYASNADGPWNTAAKEMTNTGRYVWKMPDQGLPFQFFIKLECSDLAGNKAAAITQTPIKVDLATPRARVVGVTAVGISPDNPGGSGGAPPTTPNPNGGVSGNTNPMPLGNPMIPMGGNPMPSAGGNPNTAPSNGSPQQNGPPNAPSVSPTGSPGGSGPNNPLPGNEVPKPPAVDPGTNPPPGGSGTSISLPPSPPSSPNNPKPQPLPSGSPGPGGAPGNPTSQSGGAPAFPNLPGLPPG